jgi:hypothetical protein
MKIVAVLFLFSSLLSSSDAQLLFGEACDALIARVLSTVETSNCKCQPDIFSLSIGLDCKAGERVCVVPNSEVLCGFPQVTFGLDFRRLLAGRLPFTTSVCYANATVGASPIPSTIPVCITSGRGALAYLNSDDAASAKASARVGKGGTAAGSPCTARFGKTECTSCTICDSTARSVTMNCTNIDPSFAVSTCTALPLGV